MTTVNPQERFSENDEQIKSRIGNEGNTAALQTAHILFPTTLVGKCKTWKRILYAVK